MSKSGIVNVRMVITEEKILSNIDKVQKMINPKSKKQIVQLEEDTYFKDMIESIKTYLLEYPKKKNFPSSVYKEAYGLVEYATNQFEENTKNIEQLIRQRENNIALAGDLKGLIDTVINKEPNWQKKVVEAQSNFGEDIIDTLKVVGESEDINSDNYKSAVKLLKARVNNLESNLHIEIDMERIEDRSKALSFIGIEIADALKTIPTPVDAGAMEYQEEQIQDEYAVASNKVVNSQIANIKEEQQFQTVQQQIPVQAQVAQEQQEYFNQTSFEVKPSLWQRIKNSKIGRAVSYIMRIRIVLDVPALPEGRGENSF